MKRLSLFLAILLATMNLYAQVTLKGKIIDDRKEPIAGATIIEKGTKKGTISDFDGYFTIQVEDSSATLLFSYIGYENKEVKAKAFSKKKAPLSISLNEDIRKLDEVVVTGYSVPKTKKATSTVAASHTGPSGPTGAIGPIRSTTLSGRAADVAVKESKYKTSAIAAPALAKAERASTISKVSHFTEDMPGSHTVLIEKAETMTILKNKELEKISVPKGDIAFFEDIKSKKIADDEVIEPEPSAGQLTAGEWNDLKNWDFWKKSLDSVFKPYANQWKMNLTERVSVILRGSDDQPVADATVILKDSKGQALWTARTNNEGKAELYQHFTTKDNAAQIIVIADGLEYPFKDIKSYKSGINTFKINKKCTTENAVDIAFVVDATGSMGDEIAYLKSELADVIRRVKQDNQTLSIQLGSVFYRDFGDEYVAKVFPFNKSLKQNLDFIKRQNAGGGGDFEEAVPEGLEAAIDSMAWRSNAVARLLFLVLDAPPHFTPQNIEKLQRLVAKAAAKGIRIVPVTASGVDQNTEYLMKSFAVGTGGTYIFLTDDSGIGNVHLKATTEKYETEHLNDLLVRLIKEYTQFKACEELQSRAVTGGDTQFGLSFKAFPNPARDIMTVELSTAVNTVFITDISGRILKHLSFNTEGSYPVDVSDMVSGIYFLNFRKDNAVCTKKFSVLN
jgi:hypothetical protein